MSGNLRRPVEVGGAACTVSEGKPQVSAGFHGRSQAGFLNEVTPLDSNSLREGGLAYILVPSFRTRSP